MNVNTFMVHVGRFKRWTKPSVYRMMPWQHPSARKISRKTLNVAASSHNRICILAQHSALYRSYIFSHKFIKLMYV